MQLRLPCRDLCLGRGQGLLRFIKFCTRGPAALEKLLLPRKSETRLGQRRLGREQIGLRRMNSILLVVGVEPRDDLAWRNRVANIDQSLGHMAVEAKRQIRLVLRADLARQRHGFARSMALDCDGAHRPCFRGERGGAIAAGEGCGHQSGAQELRFEHDRGLSER